MDTDNRLLSVKHCYKTVKNTIWLENRVIS